jgi:hypothetical protein
MTTAKAKATPKQDKEILMEAVSALNKCLNDYKKERKADWKLFKIKFNADMDTVQKSLKVIAANHKK